MSHVAVAEKRPRPVRRASQIIGGIVVILNGVPGLFLAFELIDWNAVQIGAYSTFVGVLAAGISIALGLRAEKAVTPVADPRDDLLVPLVPIANDGLDD
jgi:hypothetical protein